MTIFFPKNRSDLAPPSNILPPAPNHPATGLTRLCSENINAIPPCLAALDGRRRLICILNQEFSGHNQPDVLLDGSQALLLFSRSIGEDGDRKQERQYRFNCFLLPPDFKTLSMRTRKGPISFFWRGKLMASIDRTCLFSDDTPPARSFFSKIRGFLSDLPSIHHRYQNSWLLVDRDFKADDNAEHLYRWIMRHRPEQKIFFALNRNSPDWNRLKNDGFRLIPLGSLWYFFAWVHCSWLIASNFHSFIRRPRWRRIYPDMVKHQFCFLQHGITKDYQPSFNKQHFDMLVTGAEREQDAFINDERYPYIYSEREVQLTGFPRHDELIRKAKAVKRPNIILIVPTWRKSLVGEFIPKTVQYPYSETFRESAFFQNWQRVIQYTALHHSAEKLGYELRFFPHAYIRQQMRDFDFSGIIVQQDAGGTIQDMLAKTALLITDYSSMAMEAAMIRRPVLYFHFDKDVFRREHSYKEGYFDYTQDGFGEIALTADELCSKALSCMENGCAMPALYQKRADTFFAFNDQNNCLRVYETLVRLSQPAKPA